jgi:hypothetical protein
VSGRTGEARPRRRTNGRFAKRSTDGELAVRRR